MGVRKKWEFQTHSACDYRYIGPGHAVAILVCENTAALNTLTHRLLRPGAEKERQAAPLVSVIPSQGGKHTKSPYHPPICSLASSLPEVFPMALPCWEGGGPFLLARGIHVTDSKVLGDLLHILEVEEGVETGFIYETRTPVDHKLSSSPQFSSAQQC